MGRGPVVAGKKAAWDAVKQKVYSIHSKLIAMAAQKWGDPDTNHVLADAIAKARKDSVPTDNITRAIKKWTWADKWAEAIQEITYEGYWAGWVAVIVKCLTDNKNRTASDIRHIFSKFGWNMWESGSVSWMFKRVGVIRIDANEYDAAKIEEMVFETAAQDFKVEGDQYVIVTEVEDLIEVTKYFDDAKVAHISSKFEYNYDTEWEITEMEKLLKVTKMLEAFEDSDDVAEVYSNCVADDALHDEVDAFIAKNTFRS